MGVSANLAIMVDAGRRVDDSPATDTRTGLDDNSGHDLGSVLQLVVSNRLIHHAEYCQLCINLFVVVSYTMISC